MCKLVVPTGNASGAFAVSWTSVSRATSYRLQEQVNGGAFGEAQNTGATQRAVSGKGTARYGYRVAACNEAGCSGNSAVGSVVVNIPPPVPAAPQLLEAWYYFSEGNTTYQGGWTAVPGATRYEYSGAAGCISTQTSCSVVVRGAPEIREFTVIACNVAGCSPPSNGLLVRDGFEL